MAERYLELHTEFRDRWILFHLVDGTVLDSREINWRRVEWERVVRLEAILRGHRHVVTCQDPRFQFFLNFKVARHEATEDGRGRLLRWWVIGWTDGETAYLTAVDFKTGREAGRYTQPLEQLAGHIHPRVQHLRAAAVPGTRTQEELQY